MSKRKGENLIMKDELDLDFISLICFILSIITMILSLLLVQEIGDINMIPGRYVLLRFLYAISMSLLAVALWIPILPHLKGKFAFIAVLILILLIIFSMISKTFAQIAVMFLTIVGVGVFFIVDSV